MTKTLTTTRPSRADSENTILMLCEHYPSCFSEKQRRPLKRDIAADIIRDDDFTVASELITSAVEWYESHSYDYALSVAGSKRIDLNGREVGTVTEQEALSAKQRIGEFNKKRAAQSPVQILNKMHSSGQITGVTFPTLWRWMKEGKFPRSRALGGKSVWIENEIADWVANRPVILFKGEV